MPTADEEAYKKELADNGVELPEEKKDEPDKPAEEAPKPKEEPKAEPEKDKPEDPKTPLSEDPKEPPKPRSIYDDLKDKKKEVKTERELRVEAERQRDELQQKQDAQDELDVFAAEIGADPVAIKKMRDLFLKGYQPEGNNSISKEDFDAFKTWQADHAKTVEKQVFEEEFAAVTPTIKEMFPKATDEELGAIKIKLDELGHTKEWHDKSLDYVVFKNKDTLAALVSPKKRGMEPKERKDFDENSFEFDPNADLSKMTMKQRELWEEHYHKATKSESLAEDGQGRKILI
jgi:hypothetical protein